MICLAVCRIFFSVCTTDDQADRPTLLECVGFQGKERRINIPQEIGTKYFQFGVLLLEDSTGARIHDLEHRYHGDTEMINVEVLREWVWGSGKHPVTWNTLVEVLFDIGLDALAADIVEVRCQTTQQRELSGEQILMCKVVCLCTIPHQIAGLVCYNQSLHFEFVSTYTY